MPSRDYTTVSIPVILFEKVKKRIEDTGFTSVSSFVTYVLRELISEPVREGEPFSKEEKEKVIEKLRGLGYL